MNPRVTVIPAVAIALSGVTALAWSLMDHRTVPPIEESTPAVSRGSPLPAPYAGDSLSQVVIGRDLFRVTRSPSPAAVATAVASASTSQAIPKPKLRLVGLVHGNAAAVILEGVPGAAAARTVGVGDTVGGLVVRSINHGVVVVAGFDTVWSLRIRSVWP